MHVSFPLQAKLLLPDADRKKLYGALRDYQMYHSIEELVSAILPLLDTPTKLDLLKDIRNFVPGRLTTFPVILITIKKFVFAVIFGPVTKYLLRSCWNLEKYCRICWSRYCVSRLVQHTTQVIKMSIVRISLPKQSNLTAHKRLSIGSDTLIGYQLYLYVTINSYSASHDKWCTAILWNRIMTAQCEGMGEVGSARYEPALLPPCPSIRALCYSNCQRSTQSHQQSKG